MSEQSRSNSDLTPKYAFICPLTGLPSKSRRDDAEKDPTIPADLPRVPPWAVEISANRRYLGEMMTNDDDSTTNRKLSSSCVDRRPPRPPKREISSIASTRARVVSPATARARRRGHQISASRCARFRRSRCEGSFGYCPPAELDDSTTVRTAFAAAINQSNGTNESSPFGLAASHSN